MGALTKREFTGTYSKFGFGMFEKHTCIYIYRYIYIYVYIEIDRYVVAFENQTWCHGTSPIAMVMVSDVHAIDPKGGNNTGRWL